MGLKKEYLIEKRNVLNEIRSNGMTLQELRFFSIYLAKINSRDISTRVVRFKMYEFQKIMEFGRLNLAQIKNTIDSLLCKIVGVPLENGGFERFQLFKKGIVGCDENQEWYVEIDAHDDALPLMFEFKEKYFTYELWNALKLKSSNQLRMYEILKQYELVGERVITIDELRTLIGIDKTEYPRFGDFKKCVLDACRQSLKDNTDIQFTYEIHGKRGRGGKVLALKFTITKNTEFVDQLSLGDFLFDKKSDEEENENLKFYLSACNDEFSLSEIQVLYNLATQIIPFAFGQNNELKLYDYIKHKYDELNWQASRRKINKRFGYLKKIIEADKL